MKTIILATDHPESIPHACQVLDAGGLIVFPTDTVYGLAVRVDNPEAIDRLFESKGRESTKAIAVLVGSMEQVAGVAKTFPRAAQALTRRFWPGALTLVVERRAALPANLTPDNTVGLRMPDHPFALKLLRASGALAVSSANLAGGANASTAQEALLQLDGRVDLILDGGRCPGGAPSTVVRVEGEKIQVLRQGPISAAALDEALYSLLPFTGEHPEEQG